MKKGKILLMLASLCIIPLKTNYFAFEDNNIIKADKEYLLDGTHQIVTEYEETDMPTIDDLVTLDIKNKINMPSYKTTAAKQIENAQDITLSEATKDSALTSIINTIKNYDSSFSEEDYKIEYNLLNDEENTGTIFFKYYINNTIETNKVYLAEIVDGVVSKIILGGVLEKNLENIQLTDNEKLLETVEYFTENLKKQALLNKSTYYFKTNNILNKDNTINQDNLIDEVVKSSEKITYDYNSKKLQYGLYITYKTPTDTFDGDVIEIELN